MPRGIRVAGPHSAPFLPAVVGVFSGSCSSLRPGGIGGGGLGVHTHPSPLLEAVFFAFIEEICLRASQIDNLWATISLENRKIVIFRHELRGIEDKKNFWINGLAMQHPTS